MSAPGEDLAQGHTADGRRPTSKGVFLFIRHPQCASPDIPTRREGVFGSGVQGQSPAPGIRTQNFFGTVYVTRVFLKKSVL